MWRAILGIVVGWLAMGVVVALVFMITMMAMGPQGAYRPGTYWTTGTFNTIVMVGGFAGAVVGGLVCALIAGSRGAAQVLAVIVLTLGLVSAMMNMRKPDPAPPTGAPTFEEGATRGKEPTWFAFTAPIVGAAGIVIGSGFAKRKSPAPLGA